MRRLPIVATTIVALAIAVMIMLGLWQLGRAHEKDAALEVWRANMSLPTAAYPAQNPADESYMFRRLSGNCLHVVSWQVVGGRTRDGQSGWRYIASCATGAEGPGLVVDMGVSKEPNLKLGWSGGLVSGYATHEPNNSGWLDRLRGHASPLRLMIIADAPAPGLMPSAAPDPASVPNNHLSYMVQWFLFAGVAAIIYIIALRGRKPADDSAA